MIVNIFRNRQRLSLDLRITFMRLNIIEGLNASIILKWRPKSKLETTKRPKIQVCLKNNNERACR